MKTQRLQAEFARRREAEHLRIEKNTAVNNYFDHWGKVTSRFKTWTDAEYYENAEQNLRKTREQEEKNLKLFQRQEKLRALLESEAKTYETELNNIKRRPSKNVPIDVLQKIDKEFKEREEERRRLQLESKLYSRLRYGSPDESLLFQGKTNNEVLAKLNWLDKQIEQQMHKDDLEKETQLLNLRQEEEARKREEFLAEREKIQESEIKELRAIQEKHIDELKLRESESNDLEKDKEHLKNVLSILEKELELLSSQQNDGVSKSSTCYNVRKIKMFIRQRSDEIRKDLRNDIEILKRISSSCKLDSITLLIDKFEMQYDLEIQKQSQIESMYESEAKYNLSVWEDAWSQESKLRKAQIRNVLMNQKKVHEEKFKENHNQQRRLIDVIETHLAAIENANKKLQVLIQEQEGHKMKKKNYVSVETIDDGAKKNAQDLSKCELQEIPTVPPKFGRKKVAWT